MYSNFWSGIRELALENCLWLSDYGVRMLNASAFHSSGQESFQAILRLLQYTTRPQACISFACL